MMAFARLLALWDDLRGSSPKPEVAPSSIPDHFDTPEMVPAPALLDLAEPPVWAAQSITGRHAVIIYSDARKQKTERQIICRRLENHGGDLHLMALCLMRSQLRQFRVDRIVQFIDNQTGEVFEPGAELLTNYAPDLVSFSPFHYGLSPRQYADFNAALNVLAFVARCDGHFDLVEAEAIAEFATAFWLRSDFTADLDPDQVIRHARSLNPDPESLWVSLVHCTRNPIIARILERHVAAVIDADGVHDPNELYWAQAITAVLRESS